MEQTTCHTQNCPFLFGTSAVWRKSFVGGAWHRSPRDSAVTATIGTNYRVIISGVKESVAGGGWNIHAAPPVDAEQPWILKGFRGASGGGMQTSCGFDGGILRFSFSHRHIVDVRRYSQRVHHNHNCLRWNEIARESVSLLMKEKFPSVNACLVFFFFFICIFFFAHSSIAPVEQIGLFWAQAAELVLDGWVAYAPQGQMVLKKGCEGGVEEWRRSELVNVQTSLGAGEGSTLLTLSL